MEGERGENIVCLFPPPSFPSALCRPSSREREKEEGRRNEESDVAIAVGCKKKDRKGLRETRKGGRGRGGH